MTQLLFTDTHCHIHDPEFFPEGGQAPYDRALKAAVHRMLCVGTDIRSSKAAVEFAATHEKAWATVGIHPHDAKKELVEFDAFASWCQSVNDEKLVAVGEIGLDYYYNNSPRDLQIELLNRQIELAQRLNIPITFHVRDAFDDFWPIFDSFKGLRGVLHSFTDSLTNMGEALERDLYIGVNGIATFARDRDEVTKAIPLEKMLLETDAPFLTPTPYRGKVNEPAFVPTIARFVTDLRSISLEELSDITEKNAKTLFF